LNIWSLFGKKPVANKAIISNTYAHIVKAARAPELYINMHISDTPLSRLESLSLHVILFLYRCQKTHYQLAQDIVDCFFNDLDQCIRELGVSDAGMPKSMKKLAKMFYGRVASYHSALSDRDFLSLRDALMRNIWPDIKDPIHAKLLASYMLKQHDHLVIQTDSHIESGEFRFLPPSSML
jgi:cytochrome b pre-mRNA-processing protein 3